MLGGLWGHWEGGLGGYGVMRGVMGWAMGGYGVRARVGAMGRVYEGRTLLWGGSVGSAYGALWGGSMS